MSTEVEGMGSVNATGYGNQDLRSEDGGNNSRGVFDQPRPTAVVARGNSKKVRKIGDRK